MNIKDLTIGQATELLALFNTTKIQQADSEQEPECLDDFAIGYWVIIRTDRAGVWFGNLEKKAGREVILKEARRMWSWHAAESISLSACAIHGIKRENSKIAEAVDAVWLEAIEILPCTPIAIESIGYAPVVEAV